MNGLINVYLQELIPFFIEMSVNEYFVLLRLRKQSTQILPRIRLGKTVLFLVYDILDKLAWQNITMTKSYNEFLTPDTDRK